MGKGDADFAAAVWAHSGSGVIAVDARGRLGLLNPAGRRILGGRCASAPLGAPIEDAFAERPALVRLLREALAGRGPRSRAELALERPGAAPQTLGFSHFELPGDDGGPRGAALVFRDLAPIERAGERERLQQRLAALGEMAAGLAHELRNPLASMELAAGLLARRVGDDPESLSLLGDLRGQLRQLSQTVGASLEFLRPPALRLEPLDPVEALDEALALAQRRGPVAARIQRRQDAALPKLTADRPLLGVALVNLIANAFQALEASGADGRLELAIERGPAPDELCFSVADNGPGVPECDRDRIFEPFFTTRPDGSGIGLATVQKVAAAHGGSLSLETGPGGSVFRLHLPLDGAAR
jgi:signal transduction histidine kinase